MPYKLQLPASGYISIPTWSAAVGQDFLIEAIFDTPPTIETDGVLGNLDGDNFLATLSINNGAVLTRLGGVLINGDGNSPVNQNIFEPSNKYSYRVERVSNLVRTTVTNLTTSTVKQDISGVAFTDAVIFTRIGDTQGLTLGGGSFYTIELTRSGDNRYYDANASGGTGTVLPDTINSANNGTQVGSGWSAANWVFYSSGAYTLTADGATFSYSGGIASTIYNRLLSADGGSFSYSDGVAETLLNRRIAADGATFGYSGGVSALLYGRALQASGGSFSYSGGVATFVYNPITGYVLNADGGIFSYAGGEAALSFNQNYPTANPNDYTVSAYLSTDSTYTARLSESSTINAIISASSTFNARLN